jgi:hypothetical protein
VPLSVPSARLRHVSEGVRKKTRSHQDRFLRKVHGASADERTIPIESMRYWVLGWPDRALIRLSHLAIGIQMRDAKIAPRTSMK